MTDIVERLRKTASRGVSVWGDLQMEAADVIDTLRARLAQREAEPWKPDWSAFVEYWAHESHLQTYADRERFRAAVKAMTATPPAQPAPAPVVPDGWVSVVDRLPKPGQAVLASMLTPRMLRRTIRAHHSPLHTVDASNWEDETAVDATEDGNAWEPEGWYEDPVIGEMLEFIGVSDGDVTHWMPLPAAPGSAPAVPDPAMGNPISPMKPLSGDMLYALWASENGLEDCKMCKLNDFTKAARFFEQANGIGTTGGGNG